jgi:hypothetical protein
MGSYYVNASTSLIQAEVSSIVYLSSLYSPGTLITIRDFQGKARADSTILLSTTQNISFYDGTSTVSITQPFGFLTITPRTSTTWTLVNSFAFQESAEATVDQITAKVQNVSTMFADFISTKQVVASSIGVNVASSQYSLDVGGIINATDFFKNGQPFVASGDIPVIRTSTISINDEVQEEIIRLSTLLVFNGGSNSYKSIDYGESWTPLSNVSFSGTGLNPVYNFNELSWYYFYQDGNLQALQSYNLSNWTNCNLNLNVGSATPVYISLYNSQYFVTFGNTNISPLQISSDFTFSNQIPLLISYPFNSLTTSIKYLSDANLYVATSIIDVNLSNITIESVQFSSDLTTWHTVSTIGQDTPTISKAVIFDVEYGLGLYVVGGQLVGGTTNMLYTDNLSSLNGFSNSPDFPSGLYPLNIAFNGTTFVTITTDDSTNNTNSYYSINGSNWLDSGQAIPVTGLANTNQKIKWNGVNFVVTNRNDSNSYYSPDGITWTAASGATNFTDYTIGITSTSQSLANLQLGQTKIYTRDPILVDSNINQLVFYSTMMKINNSIYISNTGEIGINTSTMYSIFNVNGTLTTSSLDLIDSTTHLTASSGTLFVNDDPLLTSTVLGNYTLTISTLSTLTITNTLNVINPGVTGTVLASSIGVNCNAPKYELDVSGSLYALTLFGQSVSAPQIIATQIGVNCNAPTDAVDVNGTLRATTGWFNTLGVNNDIPSYTLDITGSFNTTSLYINGSLYSTPTSVFSTLNLSTIGVFGPGGSNVFIPSTFFDKPLTTSIINTSTLKYYKPSGTTSVYEPLTVNSFLSVNNRNTSNIWVAVGRDTTNLVKFSTDGSTWQNATGATFSGAQEAWAVEWNGRNWLTAISDTNSSNATFFTSQTGSTWTQVSPSGTYPNNTIRDLVWTGQHFIAVGNTSGASNTTIARSTDGITWTSATSGGFSPTNGCRGIAFNGRRLVAVGFLISSSNETIQYSDDLGNTWLTVSSNGFDGNGRSVATNGSIWVALGNATSSNATIKYSYNGVTWSNISSNGFTLVGLSVAWNGSRFVAVGNDTVGTQNIKYSDDGINWFNASSGLFSSGGQGHTVAWNGSLWAAGGLDSTSNARLKTSLNGITWTDSVGGAFSSYTNGIGFSSNVYPDFQVENLSFFGKNLFNTVYSTNSIHIQTSSILINNALRVNQPQLTIQSLSNPTVDIIGTTRVQTLLTQSTLGINIANPTGVLDIALPSTAGVYSNYPIIRGNISSETAVSTLLNTINTWCSVLPVPQSNSASMVLYYRGGTAGNSNYKASITGTTFFTGQHANLSVDPRLKVTTLSSCVGLIVSSADQGYFSMLPNGTIVEGKDAIWITEALPKIKLADKDCDKAVWGVITNHMNENYTLNGQRDLDYQSLFASPLQGRLRVNGIGEGAIWVTNINGPLANGDYICSSLIPGYGRKQDDDVVHNYTVAKATMSCTFVLNQSSYRCEEFTYNGQTYRRAYIGCSYHCS